MGNSSVQSPVVLERKLSKDSGAEKIGFGSSTVAQAITQAQSDANKYSAEQQLPVLPSRNKLIWKHGDNQYYVVTPKAGDKGYVLIIMERGVVTSSSSIGGDADLLRVTGVVDLLDAWGGKHTYSSTNGVWTESTYNFPNSAAVYGVNDAASWWANNTLGNWIEWTTTTLEDGKFNIKFYTSASSSNNVSISVDGVVVDTISLSNADGGLFTYEGKCTTGLHTLRVTNNANARVYVFGVNYHSIKEHPVDRTPEAFAYFRTDTPYITNKGASDYAIYNINESKWGGSYHGGETLVTERMLFDGGLKVLSTGQLQVFKDLIIEQQTQILWPVSGDNFTVDTQHHFNNDAGYTFSAVFDGNADVKTFYTCMSTTQSSFVDVKFPVNKRLTGVGGDLPLSRNNVVCQRDPASLNSLWNKFTLFNDDNSNYRQDGAFIYEAVGTYNKLYYGSIVDDATGRNVRNMAFSVQKIFN